jgi:predicted nucleotidyltransferase
MNATSLDLSSKIDAITRELLTILNKVTRELDIPFFVTGATARDIILEHAYGIKSGLATKDFDLGVMVENWEHYQKLLKTLVLTERFTVKDKVVYTLWFEGKLPVDLIAFGEVEAKDASISWPPDHSIKLNVMGFKDAWAHAVQVRIAPGQEIRIVSPAGLAMLKLIAWRDRHHEAPLKDAADLALLLTRYVDAGNQERLYEHHPDLLEAEHFDLQAAGARMLGRDMALIMSKRTTQAVLETLNTNADPNGKDKLIIDILQHLPDRDYEKALRLLQSLKQGILDSESR